MWDVDTLHYLNDLAVERSIKAKTDKPLEALVFLLEGARPPSLSILISFYDKAEEFSDFVKLVKEYLPEREQEILREPTPSAQVAKFASYFEDRYLPLHSAFKDGGVEDDYAELLRDIPVEVMGIGWEDYETLNDYRLGIQLMSFLIESPIVNEEGQRVSLADGLPSAYQVEAERLPAGGVKLQAAQRILKGKKWTGLRIWAEILHQSTNNWFLDTDDEARDSGMINEWDKETVEQMAKDWKKAEAMYNQAMNFAAWLEDDELGTARFKETIDFLLSNLTPEDYKGGEDG